MIGKSLQLKGYLVQKRPLKKDLIGKPLSGKPCLNVEETMVDGKLAVMSRTSSNKGCSNKKGATYESVETRPLETTCHEQL
jgi:hypothetical protein